MVRTEIQEILVSSELRTTGLIITLHLSHEETENRGGELISLWLEEARGKSRPKIFPKTLVPVSNSHSLVSPKLPWHLTRIAVSLKIPFCSAYFFIFGSKLWSTVSPQRIFLGSFEKVMCHRSCVATQPGCGSRW